MPVWLDTETSQVQCTDENENKLSKGIYQGVYQIQQLPNGQQVYIQQTEVDHSEQDGS